MAAAGSARRSHDEVSGIGRSRIFNGGAFFGTLTAEISQPYSFIEDDVYDYNLCFMRTCIEQ
jgi:hypothetical protein